MWTKARVVFQANPPIGAGVPSLSKVSLARSQLPNSGFVMFVR